MNSFKTHFLFLASFVTVSAFGSGFSLYEPSALSQAMGGALLGKAMDASANVNNPATLTDITNVEITVGFVTEHPRGDVRARRNCLPYDDYEMDPGLFWLPHIEIAVPLKWGFAFGLSASAEYGLGTSFGDTWLMNWSTTDTTVEGFVINPNLAYKITDKWSVAVGLRWLFFDFEQYSKPYCAQPNVDFGPYGVHTANFGNFSNRLKGDNGWKSLGWQIGTKYDILDNLSVGAVYKSAIDVTVEGKSSNTPFGANVDQFSTMAAGAYGLTAPQMLAYQSIVHSGDAEADLRMPQSVAFGVNWDVTKAWHLGAALSWTEWSEFDSLKFKLPGGERDVKLGWNDTWRASIGSCWDFAPGWKWMISYVYDMDCTADDQTSAMLPPANRHIASTGFAWNIWEGLEIVATYSCVFMDGGDMRTTDAVGNVYDLETCWGYCHAVGVSFVYRF